MRRDPSVCPSDAANAPPDALSPDALAPEARPPTAASHDCPVLVSETLVLRAPHAEDIDAIAILANNPAVATMLSRMPHPYTRADAETFVQASSKRENGNCVYAITETESGRFLGCVGLQIRDGGRSAELGYWIGEPFWGRGIATEAVHAVIAMAFRTRDIDYVDARCRVTNPASRRVLQKSGFQFQGTEMVEVLALGASVSMEWFRLDRKTWISLISWSSQQR
jgi:RimJ/RimL family protein N-acetyltransferase